MGRRSGSYAYLHSIFQRSLWVYDGPFDGLVGGFESPILLLLRMVDDVPGKQQQGLECAISLSFLHERRSKQEARTSP